MLLFFFIKITTIKRTVRNYCFQPFFYGMPSTEGRLAYESGKYCTVGIWIGKIILRPKKEKK
jgi:hypothetical protein